MSGTPVDPTLPQIVSITSVDELLRQAKRLGLVWDLAMGTIAATEGGFTPTVPRVSMDGDAQDEGISAVSFAGPLAVGMRVMVMIVPRAGNFIVGTTNDAQTKRYEIGSQANHGTTITTTEAVLETFTNFRALSQAAYRIEVDGWLLAATTTLTVFRLRKTNTAGQSLSASDAFPGGSFSQAPMRHVGYFRNVTNESILTDLVLTGITLASTATWGADTERPRYVSIQYAGPAVDYPSAVNIT